MESTPDEKKRLSMERRRARNRAAMQRLRQREKENTELLRKTAESLSITCEKLVQHNSINLILGSSTASLPECDSLLQQLEDAKKWTRDLMEEHDRLQLNLADSIKLQDRIQLLVTDVAVAPAIAHELVAPSRGVSPEYARQLIEMNRQRRLVMKEQWKVSGTRSSKFFDWDVRYTFGGDDLHLEFIKLFRNCSATEVADRAWHHTQQLKKYQPVPNRPQMVQRLSDTAFVDAVVIKDAHHSDQAIFRYTLRFREDEEDGTIIIGAQTIPPLGSDPAVIESTNSWAIDLCLSIQIARVVDASGVENCRVEFAGRVKYGYSNRTPQDALEMVFSILRWEEVNVPSASSRLQW